jgi:hypothetical protein
MCTFSNPLFQVLFSGPFNVLFSVFTNHKHWHCFTTLERTLIFFSLILHLKENKCKQKTERITYGTPLLPRVFPGHCYIDLVTSVWLRPFCSKFCSKPWNSFTKQFMTPLYAFCKSYWWKFHCTRPSCAWKLASSSHNMLIFLQSIITKKRRNN